MVGVTAKGQGDYGVSANSLQKAPRSQSEPFCEVKTKVPPLVRGRQF